jgi:hypothetical protein
MCTADNVRPKWRAFDYEAKSKTGPPSKLDGELVWIIDGDGNADLGYFDGVTFYHWSGHDDISVEYWAPVTYPSPPAATRG